MAYLLYGPLSTLPRSGSWLASQPCLLMMGTGPEQDYDPPGVLPPHSWAKELQGACCSLGGVRLFATPWTAACRTSLSFTISRSLFEFMFRVGDAIQPPHPLSSPSPPASVSPSIRVFSNELDLHIRRPKDWSLDTERNGVLSVDLPD